MPKDVWPGAGHDGPDLTDEEIQAVLAEADRNMPSMMELARKHLAGRGIRGLQRSEADADGEEDDDPDDSLWG